MELGDIFDFNNYPYYRKLHRIVYILVTFYIYAIFLAPKYILFVRILHKIILAITIQNQKKITKSNEFVPKSLGKFYPQDATYAALSYIRVSHIMFLKRQ